MDNFLTILLFIVFIIYSLYRNKQKAAKKKAAARPAAAGQDIPKPVKDIFESLFGEEFSDDEVHEQEHEPHKPTPEPVRAFKNIPLKSTQHSFKPLYDDMNRPKKPSLKTQVQTNTKSTEINEPALIQHLFKNDRGDLRKAIIYQMILERPYS